MNKHFGFTLAEVLITLGIIGVVAAMTLPVWVSKYKKITTVTQLKRSYTVLTQAIERSKAEYGDVKNWDVLAGGASLDNRPQLIESFVSTYIVPYLAKVKDVKYTTVADFGYKGIINPNGTEPNWMSMLSEWAFIVLNDGTILGVSIDTHNYGTIENPDHRLTSFMFSVDLNGLKSPNCSGKDIFLLKLNISTGKLEFYNYSVSSYADIKRMCHSGGNESRQCGHLIMLDGWDIKDDYPW